MSRMNGLWSRAACGAVAGMAIGIGLSIYCVADFDAGGTAIYWPGMIANLLVIYLLPLAVIGGFVGAMIWVCGG
jgi:hypothetical protein